MNGISRHAHFAKTCCSVIQNPMSEATLSRLADREITERLLAPMPALLPVTRARLPCNPKSMSVPPVRSP